jgi:PrtD family type I secretion system ABC transporter
MARRLSPVLAETLNACRPHMRSAIAFSLAINIFNLALPLYSLQIYDRVLQSGSGATLFLLTLVAIGAMAGYAVLDDVRAQILVNMGVRFDKLLSTRLFALQMDNAGSVRGAEHVQALRDLDTLRGVVTGSGTLALLDLPWTVIYIGICFLLHWVLGVTVLVATAGLVALAVFNQVAVNAPLTESTISGNKSYQLTDTALRNVEPIQAMGMLPAILNRWRAVRRHFMARQAVASNRNSRIAAAVKFFRMVVQVAMMGIGAWLVIDHDMSAGALFAATMLTSRALVPIDQVVGVWRQLSQGWTAFNRLQTAFDAPSRPVAMAMPHPEGRLSVEHVSFHAPHVETPIVNDVSFELAAGESLGLVGPSGAGKSMLARMLVGIAKPSSGMVRLDGADVYTWEREGFGRAVGYLPQDTSLMSGTVRDNIARFGEASPEEIVSVARRVGVHDMILRLPNGYDTQVGEGGTVLSGGQRQRIALARALLGKPRLVVLDEPNSNLDSDGEDSLRATITLLKQEKVSVILIAHRPSLLTGVDKLLILANGQIAKFGPMVHLMPQLIPAASIGAAPIPQVQMPMARTA